MQPDTQINRFVIPEEYTEQLQRALKPSLYGREIFTGIHAYSGDGGAVHRIAVYAAAVFGALYYGAGAFLTINGAREMSEKLFSNRSGSHSDIGHVGEWPLQIFDYGLAIYAYFLHAFSNRGCLEKVKGIYRNVIEYLVNQEQELDISDFYQQLEDDILYLANRSFSNTDLLEIRLFLVELFEGIDMNVFSCPSLELDRILCEDYREILNRIKESQSLSLSNICKFLSDGIGLLGRRGTGQAVIKSIAMSVFQIGVLACSVFLVWGFSVVINESYISKISPDASGHLFGWGIEGFTNLLLIYAAYSWVIKREAVLHRTQANYAAIFTAPG